MIFNEYSDQGLYFIKFQCYVKVGIALNLTSRICTIQSSLPEKLVVLARFPHFGCYEQSIHQQLAHLHVRGEWFVYSEDILEIIRELKEEYAAVDWAVAFIVPRIHHIDPAKRKIDRENRYKQEDKLRRLNQMMEGNRRAPNSLRIPEDVADVITD